MEEKQPESVWAKIFFVILCLGITLKGCYDYQLQEEALKNGPCVSAKVISRRAIKQSLIVGIRYKFQGEIYNSEVYVDEPHYHVDSLRVQINLSHPTHAVFSKENCLNYADY